MSYDIYTGLLKVSDELDNKSEVLLRYDFGHPSLQILREKYRLDEIAGSGSDLSKSLNLLHWISDHIMHNGNSRSKHTDALGFLGVLSYK